VASERGNEKLPGARLMAWMFCGRTMELLDVLPATTGIPTVV